MRGNVIVYMPTGVPEVGTSLLDASGKSFLTLAHPDTRIVVLEY